MPTNKIAVAALAAMMLNGCVPVVMHWTKAGATKDAFMQDRYVCLQQAQQAQSGGYVNANGGSWGGTVVTNRPLFVSCMEARGYAADRNGNLLPPPDSVAAGV